MLFFFSDLLYSCETLHFSRHAQPHTLRMQLSMHGRVPGDWINPIFKLYIHSPQVLSLTNTMNNIHYKYPMSLCHTWHRDMYGLLIWAFFWPLWMLQTLKLVFHMQSLVEMVLKLFHSIWVMKCISNLVNSSEDCSGEPTKAIFISVTELFIVFSMREWLFWM